MQVIYFRSEERRSEIIKKRKPQRATLIMNRFPWKQRVEWWLPGVGWWGKWEDFGQMVLTLSYELNKFWRSNVLHGDPS